MQVFIDRCTDYNKVKPVIERGVESLGGIDEFVKKGETVFVNPNLLQGADPEKVINTHPDFIIAVVKILEEHGAEVIVGDSPGGPMSEGSLKRHYEKAGWDRIKEETDAKLNYDVGEYKIKNEDGEIIKSINSLHVLKDVDKIINLPKLKTHTLTVFTGAVKNSFGLVHGLDKAAHHGQFKDVKDFSTMLLDIHDTVEPTLNIMDGIVGMEGSGPAGGDPVKLGEVIISENGVACDIAACRSVGIPIEKVFTIQNSDFDEDDVEYVNIEPRDIGKSIRYPKGGSTPWWAPDFLGGLLSKIYLDRPSLIEENCIVCGRCKNTCPEDAITMTETGPKISWWKCIRCYCCTEVCPEEALKVE
ncbi:MAG: DUF362 domain-containing protein [Thermoplasmatota archaeon]